MIDELSRQIARRCPKCGGEMVLRTNKANGEPFFGCSEWPHCGFTEPVPEYVRLRQMGAAPLPGFE